MKEISNIVKNVIEIKDLNDFHEFWTKYTTDNNLKTEYQNTDFEFEYNVIGKEINHHIIFEYYLIKNKFQQFSRFYMYINISEVKDIDGEYAKFSIYGFLQEKNVECPSDIRVSSIDEGRSLRKSSLSGVLKLLPVMHVNETTFTFLKSPIDGTVWGKIKNAEKCSVDKFENIIIKICWRLLFEQLGAGNKTLGLIRKELFKSEEFFQIIKGTPLITLLIFSMLDYAYREDSVEQYKSLIKDERKLINVSLKKEDFIQDYQNFQKREHFVVHMKLQKQGCDNKTLWANYYTEKKVIHPFIIKEFYEAFAISEGILQLCENIVFHAGTDNKNGEGLLSLYLMNYSNSENIINDRYHEFFLRNEQKVSRSKYYMEVVVADLSGTNICKKLMENNKDFFDEQKKKGKYDSQNLSLKMFFNPDEKEQQFWQSYFSNPTKIINHYGLQIFDSIIGSKNGFLQVESGEFYYNNMRIKKDATMNHGSKYNFLCPISTEVNTSQYIYDSMFEYDYKQALTETVTGNFIDFEVRKAIFLSSHEKEEYVEYIAKKFIDSVDKIIYIDVEDAINLECLVKAALLYIFISKKGSNDGPIYLAFLKCKQYQMLEIVRIIGLFYSKQGENEIMNKVQIYVCGEEPGYEIILTGVTLQEIYNMIVRSTCLRSTMIDNIQVINKLLERVGDDYE